MEAYALREIRKSQRTLNARTPLVMRRRACGVAAISLTAATKAAPAKGKAAVPAAAPAKKPNVGDVLKKASASAFRGGVAGFMAGVVQARARLVALCAAPRSRLGPAWRAEVGRTRQRVVRLTAGTCRCALHADVACVVACNPLSACVRAGLPGAFRTGRLPAVASCPF